MIVAVLSITAGAALGLAYYKHHTTAAVIASAKKEIAYLESLYNGAAIVAEGDIKAAIARLKVLF